MPAPGGGEAAASAPCAAPSGLRRSSEQPQEADEVVALLRTRDDAVEVAETQVLLGEAEVLRQLLARRLLHDTRSGERDQRAKLRDRDVAERRERRKHARSRGM